MFGASPQTYVNNDIMEKYKRKRKRQQEWLESKQLSVIGEKNTFAEGELREAIEEAKKEGKAATELRDAKQKLSEFEDSEDESSSSEEEV